MAKFSPGVSGRSPEIVLWCEKPEGRRAPHGFLSRLRAAQRCADGISRTRLFATRGYERSMVANCPQFGQHSGHYDSLRVSVF